MWENFVTGFSYSIEYINGTIINNITSLNTTLILHDLSPQQWYIVIARLVTTDHDSWGPEPIRIHFQTHKSKYLSADLSNYVPHNSEGHMFTKLHVCSKLPLAKISAVAKSVIYKANLFLICMNSSECLSSKQCLSLASHLKIKKKFIFQQKFPSFTNFATFHIYSTVIIYHSAF